MRSFKEFITEVVTFRNNSSFAIGPDRVYMEKLSRDNEHSILFPHLDFMGRGSENTLSWDRKPKALVWGRIDPEYRVVHFVTNHGLGVYGQDATHIRINKKELENDVFARLHAVDELRKRYPNHTVHHGFIDDESGLSDDPNAKVPKLVSYDTYEKYLTGLLRDNG